MNELDPKEWGIPLFAAFGLIISQLFMYGKKVKRRVKITPPEFIGDLMQFFVKWVITVVSIQGISTISGKEISNKWQVVAVTILITTSFDTYFLKLKEIAITRLIGAGAVLFGKLPEGSAVTIPPFDKDNPPESVDFLEIPDEDSPEHRLKANLKKAFPPVRGLLPEQKEILDELGKMD